MSVREDRVRFTSGKEGIYGVVEKPDFSLIAPLEGKYLYLVEQYRYPVGQRYWEFPQGSYEDKSQVDPLEVAKGELQEETGLRPKKIFQIGYIHNAYGFCTQGAHIYVATDLEQGRQNLADTESDLKVKKFTITEFTDMLTTGQIVDSATIAAYGLLSLNHLI